MTTSEPARHALYSELERVIGPENVKTLMTHLPTHSGDELTTKEHIAGLNTRCDRLEDRFDRVADRLDQMQRTYIVTTVGSVTALTAIFSLVVTFLN